MNINIATKNLKDEIIKSVNSCGLPAVNVLYVLKDVTAEVERIFADSLKEEESEEVSDGNSN